MDLHKIMLLIYTGEFPNIELAYSLAEANSLDFQSVERDVSEILRQAVFQPHIGFMNLPLPALLPRLHRVFALSIEDAETPILSSHIALFRNLRILELYNNQLHTLCSEIQYLKSLRSLSIRQNPLSQLPETMAQLTQLVSLFISHSQLETLPDFLPKLPSLQTLDISNNTNLKNVNLEYFEQFPKLERVFMDAQQLEHFKKQYTSSNIQFLDIAKSLS